jgi:hypothetical protein
VQQDAAAADADPFAKASGRAGGAGVVHGGLLLGLPAPVVLSVAGVAGLACLAGVAHISLMDKETTLLEAAALGWSTVAAGVPSLSRAAAGTAEEESVLRGIENWDGTTAV